VLVTPLININAQYVRFIPTLANFTMNCRINQNQYFCMEVKVMKIAGVLFDGALKSADGGEKIFLGILFKDDNENVEQVGLTCSLNQPADQFLKNLKLFADKVEKDFKAKGYIE